MTKETYDHYWVTKSNKLINAQYDLSANELKVMLILASRIQPGEAKFNRFTFKATELAELLQITPEAMYKELPKVTKSLLKRQVEIESFDGQDLLQANLLSAALYRKGKGTVILEFSEFLKPYLLELHNCFTSYRLENVLPMNSKYSIRLYEVFKSQTFKTQPVAFTMTLDELKGLLCLTQKSYEKYGHVKAKVIDVAVKEINEMTDLTVTWEDERQGRKVEWLHFDIEEKDIPVQKPERKRKGKVIATGDAEEGSASSKKRVPAPKAAPKKARVKKEEPFVDYLQTVVKQKTKRHLPKKEARLLANLLNEDMDAFAPILPYLNENIENPTGLIRSYLQEPEKYSRLKGKRQVKPKQESLPLSVDEAPTEASPMTEEERVAAVERMKALQAQILGTTH